MSHLVYGYGSNPDHLRSRGHTASTWCVDKIKRAGTLKNDQESRKESFSSGSKHSFQDRLHLQSSSHAKAAFHSSRPTAVQSGVSGTLAKQEWLALECSTLGKPVLTRIPMLQSLPCLWARHQTCQGPGELVQLSNSWLALGISSISWKSEMSPTTCPNNMSPTTCDHSNWFLENPEGPWGPGQPPRDSSYANMEFFHWANTAAGKSHS